MLSLAIAVGIGALVAWQLMDSRAAIWRRTEAANTNLLFTVSHVLERTLESADRGIRHSVGMLESEARKLSLPADNAGKAGGVLAGIREDLLFAAVSGNGFGIQLVLDDQARIMAASSPPPKGINAFPDRDYFTVHRAHADAGFFMGAPFISAYDGQPSVAMSRRWNRADGSFGGVVVQTLKLSTFHELFTSFELGRHSGINVFLMDGSVVTRFPYTNDHIGASLAGTRNFERFAREREGSFTGVAAIDNVERFYVFRKLRHYPVIVNVAQSTQAILESWRRTAIWLGGATLLLMLACVSLAVFAELRLHAHRRTATRLRQAEREMRVVLDSLPVLVAYWDDQLINRMSNNAHMRWFGMSPEQIRGRHVSELVNGEIYSALKPRMDAALSGKAQTFELNLPTKDGIPHTMAMTYVPDLEQEKVKGFFVLASDISERKTAEAALIQEKERFRIILDSIKDGVVRTDAEGHIRYLNPAAAVMLGWQLDEARGQPIEQVMHVEAPRKGEISQWPLREALATRRAYSAKVEHILVDRDGNRMHIEHSGAPILDEQGELRGAVLVFHEAGKVRAMANRMSHLAQHDALTGLPNRRRLNQVGHDAVTLARAEGRFLAVLYLDLDGFKHVNDTHGHAAGDELLVAVTRRLSARLRSSDGLYRQGGDEFVVLMSRLEHSDEAQQLAHRLIECCRATVSVSGMELSVTVSIGISLYPDDATDLDALIQWADRAMYAAKKSGRNRYAHAGALLSPSGV